MGGAGWAWVLCVLATASTLTGVRAEGGRGILNTDTDSLMGLERDVINLLTPLLGNINPALQSIISLVRLGLGLVDYFSVISDKLFIGNGSDFNFGSYLPQADRKMLVMFKFLSQRLDQLDYGIVGIAESLRDLSQGMQDLVRWEVALNTLEEYTRGINTVYTRFQVYQRHNEMVEDHTLRNFAESVVSHDVDSIMSLMSMIHSMAAPMAKGAALRNGRQMQASINDPNDSYSITQKVDKKFTLEMKRILSARGHDVHKMQALSLRPSVFQMLLNALRKHDSCHLHQSQQQLLTGLYTMVALTQARGFTMLNFAWMLLKIYNEGNFTVEQEISQELYLLYSQDIMDEAQRVMALASRDFARCDPVKHIEGDTHVQLTELLQGYIENEVDMNVDNSCKKSCGYYEHTKSESCKFSTELCSLQRRCSGTLHNCQFSDADAHVCLSRDPYRRYDYVKYENGVRMGPNDECSGQTLKVDSWWRWFVHCSYCVCLCDDVDSPTTDRFVSLMPALSDTKLNKVVTGVKFVKHGRVLHVQIQQGQTLPQGQINSSTVSWIDVEPINIISTAYEEGTHFKRLSYEERNLDLDRLLAFDQHVVTGVRFRMLGSHLNMEIQITPCNFTTGDLQPYKSYWISSDNTPSMTKDPRRELKLVDLDSPTRFVGPNKIDSDPDMFLRFEPTSRHADVAQTTVPFFDAQTVDPQPGTWLSGVEIYHKGQPGSGGFVGLKVVTFDVTPYMISSKKDKEPHVPVVRADVPIL